MDRGPDWVKPGVTGVSAVDRGPDWVIMPRVSGVSAVDTEHM